MKNLFNKLKFYITNPLGRKQLWCSKCDIDNCTLDIENMCTTCVEFHRGRFHQSQLCNQKPDDWQVWQRVTVVLYTYAWEVYTTLWPDRQFDVLTDSYVNNNIIEGTLIYDILPSETPFIPTSPDVDFWGYFYDQAWSQLIGAFDTASLLITWIHLTWLK